MKNNYLYPHDHIWGVVLAVISLRAVLAHVIFPFFKLDSNWWIIKGWFAYDPNYIFTLLFFIAVLGLWRYVVSVGKIRTELGELLNHLCLLVIATYIMLIAPPPLM